MSQNDFNVANQTFPNTRVDLNGAFQALASMSGGASEPSTTYAGQLWHDTTNDLMKIRNEANSAWITAAKFDTGNDRWEIRSNIMQAASTAGITLKSSSGATILSISNTGVVTTVGNMVVVGNISVTGTVDGVDLSALLAPVEVFRSRQTLSSDSQIDFVLASGVDEHIFTFMSVKSDGTPGVIAAKISDDNKSTFENIKSERITDLTQGDTTASSMVVAYFMSASTEPGMSGKLVLSQLSGEEPALLADVVAHSSGDNFPRRQTFSGFGVATVALTDVRFTASGDLLLSGEIIYSTRTYV